VPNLRPFIVLFTIKFSDLEFFFEGQSAFVEGRWVIQDVPSQPRDSSLLMEAPEPTAWLRQA
jgi:hypothetical protein